MRIESGATTERKIRTLLLFLMIAGFAGWFAYDGWIGYPAENLREHLEQLSPAERASVTNVKIYPAVTEESLPAARQALEQIGVSAQREALAKVFGGPPSYENSDAWYYFGPAFRIKIPLERGRLTDRFLPGKSEKTATSIQWQRGLAVALAILSVYLLWLVVRVRRTHLVLDEGGLCYQGVGPIAWDEMTSLDISRFNDKGWVDLLYEQNGSQGRIRLDEYHLTAFDGIIDEICNRKSFENPLPVPAEKQADAK